MNYLDVYFSRINHLGETTAERIKESGIRTFEKRINTSVHTVRQLSVERGLHFDGIILTNKDKAYEKIMELQVSNDIPIVIGDILNWEQSDGTIEKWIIWSEKKKTNGSYRTFWIIKCNYLIKWVDKLGHLQQSWGYIVSSVDDKIKGNFRTWHSLITPQPNKYAEILLPKYPIERSTNFIIENESWTVIEYDHTSIPGVIYLSLTENKVNVIYDDLENDIADTDKIAKYDIITSTEIQEFSIGDAIKPLFTLTKNGKPISMEVDITSTNKKIAKNVDGVLTAIAPGSVELIIQSREYPQIQKKVQVIVSNNEVFSAYIEGADTIKLDRDSIYELKSNIPLETNINCTINDNSLAKIISVDKNKCLIHANGENKLGTFTLIISYNNVNYSKQITIVPLW